MFRNLSREVNEFHLALIRDFMLWYLKDQVKTIFKMDIVIIKSQMSCHMYQLFLFNKHVVFWSLLITTHLQKQHKTRKDLSNLTIHLGKCCHGSNNPTLTVDKKRRETNCGLLCDDTISWAHYFLHTETLHSA